MNGNGYSRELGALVELCRELAQQGVNVGLSDARPAVSARGTLVQTKIWVAVDTTRGTFYWRRDDREHHTIDDPAGAAARLAALIKARDAESGGGR